MASLKDFEAAQLEMCRQFGVGYEPPANGSTLGFAIKTQGERPTSGIRMLPHGGTNGWYVWCGPKSDNPDFFSALHAEPLVERCPQAIRFLALPSGYGFIVDGDYVDVWFDEALLIK